MAPRRPSAAAAGLPDGADERQPLLEWLRDIRPPPPRAGVLAAWPHGHEIQWIARKPVVATPFGTDIDARSLRDAAAFFTALDPADVRALLERRRIGFLLLENPVREVATMAALAPGAPVWAIEERGIATGSRYALREEFFDLVACRLFFLDGGHRSGAGACVVGGRHARGVRERRRGPGDGRRGDPRRARPLNDRRPTGRPRRPGPGCCRGRR